MQSRIVRAVPRLTLVSDAVKTWLLNLLLRRPGDASVDPNLACIPQDLIGREIIVKGVYEREILHAIFNDVLRSRAGMFSTRHRRRRRREHRKSHLLLRAALPECSRV